VPASGSVPRSLGDALRIGNAGDDEATCLNSAFYKVGGCVVGSVLAVQHRVRRCVIPRVPPSPSRTSVGYISQNLLAVGRRV